MRRGRRRRCPPSCIARKKAIVSVEAQLHRASDDEARLRAAQRAGRCRDRRGSATRSPTLDARQAEARESIARLDDQRRAAEAVLADAQRDAQHGPRTRRGAGAACRRSARHARRARRAQRRRRRRRAPARRGGARPRAARGNVCRRPDADARSARAPARRRGRRPTPARRATSSALEILRERHAQADETALALKTATEQQEEMIRDARRALDVDPRAGRRARRHPRHSRGRSHAPRPAVPRCGQPAARSACAPKSKQMEADGHVEPDVAAIRAAEAPDPDEGDDEGRRLGGSSSGAVQPGR